MRNKIFLLLLTFIFVTSGFLFAQDNKKNGKEEKKETAHTTTLLDFSLLTADDAQTGHNSSTKLDLSDYSTFVLEDSQKGKLDVSLAIGKWNVKLNASASNIVSDNKSIVKEVTLTDESVFGDPKLDVKNPGKVLGIRVNFPKGERYAYADIVPPFDIPTYLKNDGGDFIFQNGKGAIDNVKTIKQVSAVVCGRNYPHKLQLILRDESYNEKIINLGDFKFVGWKRLVWNNPFYIERAENRPFSDDPFYVVFNKNWKVVAIRIVKDIMFDGGDFIGYVKQFDIAYDKNVIEMKTSIDDEANWQILTDHQNSMLELQKKRLGKYQTLKYFEERRIKAE